MVKVGNTEWELAKLTPRSRIAAIVGALSGETELARKPSGMNRTKLRGLLASSAQALSQISAHADSAARALPDNAMMVLPEFLFSDKLLCRLGDETITVQVAEPIDFFCIAPQQRRGGRVRAHVRQNPDRQ